MGCIKQALEETYMQITETAKIVLVINMPDGSSELIINEHARKKIEYIIRAYNDDLQLISNPAISIQNWMIYE